MYADGESLILDRVRGCSGFNAANTSRCDWKILDSGKSDHYAILRPGPFEVQPHSGSIYRMAWTTIIEIWQRYTNEIDTPANLYRHAEALIHGVMPWVRLGDASGRVLLSIISGGDPPQEMWASGGGPAWLKWEIRVAWQETVQVEIKD